MSTVLLFVVVRSAKKVSPPNRNNLNLWRMEWNKFDRPLSTRFSDIEFMEFYEQDLKQ